jgi:restriction system protein
MSKNVPKVWLVRAGRRGEDEARALESSRVIIGFREAGDLRKYSNVDALAELFVGNDKEANENRARNRARQVWAFKEGIANGDTVMMPLKSRAGHIAVGRVTGKYEYSSIADEMRHTRSVEWTHPELPRSSLDQDLLYSLGAFMTVCRISRNDAERRIQAILEGGKDPGAGVSGEATKEIELEAGESVARVDIERLAQDDVSAFIRKHFQSHDLARLVEAILKAEGFVTVLSEPGPDGGVDILAGRGPFGLDHPYLCVQVKATNEPAGVEVYRQLGGTMKQFKATQGLFVSWSGFKKTVLSEARKDHFEIRLWNQDDLVKAIYRNYPKLDAQIQAELPLKAIWILVNEPDETVD